MGAPIIRYYVRYGTEDVLDERSPQPSFVGAPAVRKVILLGAPNLGSISALQNFMKGYNIDFVFAGIPAEVLMTMPSAYQLLPHPDRDWMLNPDGSKHPRMLYEVDTWREFQASIFDPELRKRIVKRFANESDAQKHLKTLERYFAKQLKRGRNFHRALSVPVQQQPVRYVVFGGDCVLTPARCLIETVNGKIEVRLRPEQVVNRVPGVNYHKLMLEPGDGRVTKPSLLARNTLDPTASGLAQGDFPLAYSMFLCEKHTDLTGNMSFQDNLLNILLQQETTEDHIRKRSLTN
jgi:hypothetical protein